MEDSMDIIRKVLRKQPETYEHSCLVRDLATDFALNLGYSQEECETIRFGAYIHDIGKSFIDEDILFKEGRLTDEEFGVIKTHSSVGYRYLQGLDIDLDIGLMSMVIQHHERVDGTGYPFALKGDQIHPYAKLLALCDVYAAIISKRSYKEKLSQTYALESIKKGLGTHFDAELGKKFIAFIENTEKLKVVN